MVLSWASAVKAHIEHAVKTLKGTLGLTAAKAPSV